MCTASRSAEGWLLRVNKDRQPLRLKSKTKMLPYQEFESTSDSQ